VICGNQMPTQIEFPNQSENITGKFHRANCYSPLPQKFKRLSPGPAHALHEF
jgi:hypothetical protein